LICIETTGSQINLTREEMDWMKEKRQGLAT
jgi:hypothetical protein